MTRRRLLRWSLLLLTLAAFALWLEPTRVVWGWLRGDAFYQGRPTCWWRQELEHWKMHQVWQLSKETWRLKEAPALRTIYTRTPTQAEEIWNWMRTRVLRVAPAQADEAPAVLTPDPAAQAVLEELKDDSSPAIRALAAKGLEKIQCAQARLDRANLDP